MLNNAFKFVDLNAVDAAATCNTTNPCNESAVCIISDGNPTCVCAEAGYELVNNVTCGGKKFSLV